MGPCNRPLSRRSDTKDLVACIASAKGQGVSPALIEQAETLSTVSLAECKLRGFIIVCKNIALATHDHDGDMNRLRGALEVCQRLGAAADLVSEAEALFAKLKTEVALFDVVNETEASWADVGRVVEECRLETESPDYSLLPRPEPIEGPDGEMVPPPSRQMLALDALRDKLAELKELAVRSFLPTAPIPLTRTMGAASACCWLRCPICCASRSPSAAAVRCGVCVLVCRPRLIPPG